MTTVYSVQWWDMCSVHAPEISGLRSRSQPLVIHSEKICRLPLNRLRFQPTSSFFAEHSSHNIERVLLRCFRLYFFFEEDKRACFEKVGPVENVGEDDEIAADSQQKPDFVCSAQINYRFLTIHQRGRGRVHSAQEECSVCEDTRLPIMPGCR